MIQYDNEYTEQDWRRDSDARERAEDEREELAMREFVPETPAQLAMHEELDATLTAALDAFAAQRRGMARIGNGLYVRKGKVA